MATLLVAMTRQRSIVLSASTSSRRNRMQVEVTEENIVLYGLVQLTGNTSDELLMHAEQARESGYILMCRIPGADDVIDINVFEAAGSEVAEPLTHKKNPMMGDLNASEQEDV
jgi:hypothetical protein